MDEQTTEQVSDNDVSTGFDTNDFIKEASSSPPLEVDKAPEMSAPSENGEIKVANSEPTEPASTQVPKEPVKQSSNFNAQPQGNGRAELIKDLAPDVQRLFKNMSNDAFNLLHPLYRKSLEKPELPPDVADLQTKLKEAERARYYEHPDAWQLAPDVAELRSSVNDADFQARYWSNQIAELRAGRPFKELMYDKEAKQYFQGDPQELNDEEKAFKEAECLEKLTLAQQAKIQAQANLANFAKEYKTGYSGIERQLNKFGQDIFGTVDFSKQDALGQMYKETLSMFPKHMQGQVMPQMLSKAAASIKALIGKIEQLQANSGAQQAVTRTARANGPSSGASSATARSRDDNAYDAFKKLGG